MSLKVSQCSNVAPMDDEEWKIITEYPLYEVSSYGNVRRGGKQLKPHKERYIRFTLYDKDTKKPKSILAHRLVAKAFHEQPKDKDIIDHIDRDKYNNHKDNLRWVTQQENIWNKEYKGCSRKKGRSKWEAKIRDNTGKRLYLGSFTTEEEAMEAYRVKAEELRRK